MLADNTSEAYNDWGGYSLYHGLDGTANTRALKDSFYRPYDNSLFSTGNGLPYEIDAIRWLERNGYDVSYVSSTDVDEQPGQVLSHRALIDVGHDEYWSRSMYNGIERARDAGVSLAFLGANDGFWQIRYEPDRAGVPERTIVCYRYANLDPMYGKDNALVTVNWRSRLLHRPENALIGIAYANQRTLFPNAAPWRVNPAAAKNPLLAGTGLRAGASYGCNLVGYEWDEVLNNGATPKGLTVLGASPVMGRLGGVYTADTAYYRARSGAFVFASGSIYWSYALDDLRLWDFPQVLPTLHSDPCLAQSHAVPGIQELMRHVMQALLS
ncbi:MAG TPA: N,N-dimethylformamidase beta subunit family domain-containing protein [Ktedonobacterales bacterium]|nr:N,N-dimethylformamidase beta subunit family domain-containing protein [Ktedonobacterales bacterium]